jgi:hypothetical protein
MRAGVYSITHLPTGREYIGSATYVASRWAHHRHRLRNGKHHVAAMQAAWDADGEDAFEWKRLLVCREEDLRRVEMDLIKALRPAFNTLGLNDIPCKHTPEGLAKIAATTRSRYVVHDGKTLADLARERGMHRHTLRLRLKRGWTLEAALAVPVHEKHRPT